MSSPLFSSSWYRVAKLRPRLRAHTQIHRHIYRDELWYLIQDHITGRFHRFRPETYVVVGMMDGKRTLEQIWEGACERLGDDMPSQDEVIQLLGQLHRADIIQADIPPDISEIDRRSRTIRRNQFWAKIKSPLAIRIPLWNPEKFLHSTEWMARFLFNKFGISFWLLCVVSALFLAAMDWDELTSNLADRVLALENLLLLWIVYPIVKVIHEFGHGYAVKRWGGETHEMGLMLLVFMPVPYVEASASYAFRSKYQRMLVGAAGIMVEVFLASVAMMVWHVVEPGTLRVIAFDVMLVAGVSTVLFNGNPLLKFDAYYVLSDYLEIPNLGQRANKQLGYLLKKYLLGIKQDDNPPSSTFGEAVWLILYSISSFSYRMVIMITIALFVASKAFFLGVILALWSIYNFLFFPLYKTVKSVWLDEKIKRKRPRLYMVTGTLVGALVIVLFWIPAPKMTIAEGILWVPNQSHVIATTHGTVEDILVQPDEMVDEGMPLIRFSNIDLDSRIKVLQGGIKELIAKKRITQSTGKLTESRLLEQELERSKGELTRLQDEKELLIIRSPTQGQFQLTRADDLKGRYLQRGELLGYILKQGEFRGQIVVGQADIASVRGDVQGIDVRFAESIDEIYPATLAGAVPIAHRDLPSLALSLDGGGSFALDPTATEGPKSFEPFFQFEILLDQIPVSRIGERLYVRFTHSPEPLGYRWLRSGRRVLLEQLDF